MDLQSIASRSKVLLRVFSLLLCFHEALTSGTYFSDTISNSTKFSSEKTLESLFSGILFPYPNNFQAVSEGDEVEIICRAPYPVYLRYTGYSLLEKWNANSPYERINDTCFTSSIQFKAEKCFTGEYECQTFGQNSSQVSKSSVYIYVNANEPYLLLNSKGKNFTEINAGSPYISSTKQIIKPLDDERHNLSITVEFTRPEDPITYRCEASNGIQDTAVIFTTKSWIPTSIAAILGMSFFVLVICSIAYKLYKRANPFPENFKDFFDGYEETNDPFKGVVFAPHEKRYEINPKYVTRSKPCGKGQYGLVSKVEYRRRLAADSILHRMKLIFLPTPYELITCGAKIPNEICRNDDHLLTEFLKEIKSNIQVGNHKNIVKFIGCMASPSLQRNRKAAILMEYCAKGDLQKFLVENRSSFKDEFQTPSVSSGYASLNAIQTEAAVPVKNQISTSHLFQWAYEIACGLEYIASKNLYHRDVAARNVLLTEDRVAKIADLGLSRYVEGDRHYYRPIDEPTGNEDGGGNRRVLRFPIPWLPVESIRTQRFSEDSDIWAFGVTLWEIFSLGDEPIMEPDLHHYPHRFADHLAQGHRLPRPRAANQAIYDIMLRCWAAEGNDRPRFTELKELINETKSYLIMSGSATTTATHADAEYNSESASDLNGWSSGHQSSESDSENDYSTDNPAEYEMVNFNR